MANINVERYSNKRLDKQFPGCEMYDLSTKETRIGYLYSEPSTLRFVWRHDINFGGIIGITQQLFDATLVNTTYRADLYSNARTNCTPITVDFLDEDDTRFDLSNPADFFLFERAQSQIAHFSFAVFILNDPADKETYLVAISAENPEIVESDEVTSPEIVVAMPKEYGWNNGLSKIVLATHAFRDKLNLAQIAPEDLTTTVNEVVAKYHPITGPVPYFERRMSTTISS